MFYIVEKKDKLDKLEKLLRLGCYVDVISSNDNYHPKLTKLVAVYIRLTKSVGLFYTFNPPMNYTTIQLNNLSEEDYRNHIEGLSDKAILSLLTRYRQLIKQLDYYNAEQLRQRIEIGLHIYRDRYPHAKQLNELDELLTLS